MRALITGHKGYIGGNLVRELKQKGHTIAGIDLKGCEIDGSTFPGTNLCDGIPIEFYEYSPDVIFHLAAIPRVGYSVKKPVEVMENNIISTSKILRYAKYTKTPVIYSSSSSVVGNGKGPASPYALSKYVGEMEALMYNDLYKVPTVALRYFNVYSYDQVADSEYATVVCNWKKYILEARNPYITGDGNQCRDMTHVKDIVSANIFCAENIQNDKIWGEWYDIGSGENISLNELKNIVHETFPDLVFDYIEPREGDVMFTEAKIEKFKKLGWKNSVPLRQGLREVFSRVKDENFS